MEKDEMLEQTNETENTENQTVEEIEEEGLGFTDTEITEEETEITNETEEVIEEEKPKLPSKVEFTPEQQAKLDEILKKRLKAEQRKHERENAKKDYLIEKLKAGMEIEDLDEIDTEITKFYESQGKKMPLPKSSERDEQVLAKADAEEIIESGKEEMERIANEISKKPIENRSLREKTILTELVNKLVLEKAKEDLESEGISTEILEDKKFQEFKNLFNISTPITKVYEMYTKENTKTEETPPKPIGSVKSKQATNEIKDFYTYEESLKFTKADYDRNPKLFEAVEKSMTKW